MTLIGLSPLEYLKPMPTVFVLFLGRGKTYITITANANVFPWNYETEVCPLPPDMTKTSQA